MGETYTSSVKSVYCQSFVGVILPVLLSPQILYSASILKSQKYSIPVLNFPFLLSPQFQGLYSQIETLQIWVIKSLVSGNKLSILFPL